MTARASAIVLTGVLLLVFSACGAEPEPAATSTTSTPSTTTRLAALEGTMWELITYGVEATPTKVKTDRVATIVFDNGEVNGAGPCNRYSGIYETDDDAMTIELLAVTRASCGDRDLDVQEQEFLQALGNATRYDVIGLRMKIEYGKGLSLVFESR